MSTAGKVLTVLILLVMVVWIVMQSAVTQLNVNHELKIAQQQKDLDQVTEDVAKANLAILRVTEEARVQQDTTGREFRVLLGKIAAAERKQSSTIEDLTRLKFQVADYLAAVEQAKGNLTARQAEKAKAEEDLGKKRDETAKAQANNAELRGQLAQLQNDFKRLLAENTASIGKQAEKAPIAKPASNRRDSPSS